MANALLCTPAEVTNAKLSVLESMTNAVSRSTRGYKKMTTTKANQGGSLGF